MHLNLSRFLQAPQEVTNCTLWLQNSQPSEDRLARGIFPSIINSNPSINVKHAALQESVRVVKLNLSLMAPFSLQSKDRQIKNCEASWKESEVWTSCKVGRHILIKTQGSSGQKRIA